MKIETIITTNMIKIKVNKINKTTYKNKHTKISWNKVDYKKIEINFFGNS